MSLTIDPIQPWPIIAIIAAVVIGLTVWAYSKRLSGTSGRWRWFAVGLRMVALLLCILASLRPSVLFQSKSKQPSTLAFLSDASRSMTIKDAAGDRSRWDLERSTLADALKAGKSLGANVVAKAYRFDAKLTDDKVDDRKEPTGQATEVGTAIEEMTKRLGGVRILAAVLMSDGSNNGGTPPPLVAAQRLKGLGCRSSPSRSAPRPPARARRTSPSRP